MKRLSNYIMFVGLIMIAVSITIAIVYRFTSFDLSSTEKLNVTMLYVVGAVSTIAVAAYKLFKESK